MILSSLRAHGASTEGIRRLWRWIAAQEAGLSAHPISRFGSASKRDTRSSVSAQDQVVPNGVVLWIPIVCHGSPATCLAAAQAMSPGC